MKVVNNYTYSRKEYEGYKFRYKFGYEKYRNDYTSTFDIYTDNPDKKEVHRLIFSLCSRLMLDFRIVNISTKEQDDADTKFIEKILKDI